ncbi:MAG: GNAT family N-acetyltransferase [Gammaproteobacteria bacterium]|nr:MAG: GNAT family N-acetyltransferase [Gammaproteobacteria bacterium]
MPGPVFAYHLEPARTPEAGLLAAMAREQVESGLRASWDAARIAWHIRHPDSVVLAARAGTGIAGFAIMRYGDDSAHLNLLAVAPSHRRRGIARRLMNWLEGTALTAGTFTIGLELRAGNHPHGTRPAQRPGRTRRERAAALSATGADHPSGSTR